MSEEQSVSADADRATHEPNPQAVSAVPVGIADAAPIWRNGFGAAVEAIDRARRTFRPSIKRSKTARAYDQALDEALQYAFDCTRTPFRIVDYPTANEACRSLQRLLDPWLAAQEPEPAPAPPGEQP
jgi:hypothetical protein